ncbi:hypothetical protein G5714_000098 [Onychostoma macrolepis]|uniref:Uncharacterized protein n=1 Tax=Onychostoma macrolepis TaxID=369639 RepID=A0A7J6DFJ6_9TELE|nr:hypothetical protein G5714_000098 [Onychostoma macrolepis]
MRHNPVQLKLAANRQSNQSAGEQISNAKWTETRPKGVFFFPSEGHFLGLLTSGQRMESPGSRLIIKVTVILAEPVSGGLGFHHETQLPEQILQSEDDRCVMVGCFAVGGASVEAYIRMLGCTLTIEPASQINWAVGDRKISMNNNNKKLI